MIRNALARRDIKIIGELVELERKEILRIRNMGNKSFDEINAHIKTLGLPGW